MTAPKDNFIIKTPAEMVMLAKAGDKEAFTNLVLLYERELLGYLNGLLRDSNEVEDCAQQVFFKVWRKLPTLKNEATFKPWLYIIARNEARDYLRKKQKISFLSREDLNIESAFQVEAQVTEADLINLALSTLSPKLRACLQLDAWGCSHHEIAQILKISTKSVVTYLSIARKQFRRIYQPLELSKESGMEVEHSKPLGERGIHADQQHEPNKISILYSNQSSRPETHSEDTKQRAPEAKSDIQSNVETKNAEGLTEIATYVDKLLEPYQTPVRLHYIEKSTISEIAARLGRPKGTVKSQVSRGMQMLSKIMEQETEGSHLDGLSNVETKNAEGLTEIATYVDKLLEPYQTPVRLHYIEKSTISEIAARLGRPKGTVKSQVSRGMQMLDRLKRN